MSKVFIMSGLPFSGKSTLSKAISEQLKIPRISFDETWIEIENKKGTIPGNDNIEKWKYICDVCEQKTKEYLEKGISVVYDNLGSTIEQRNKIRTLANEVNAQSEVVYVSTSKEEVTSRRERNLLTTERAQVSDDNFNEALKNFEPPTESEKALVYNAQESIESWIGKEFPNNSRAEHKE